MEALSSAGSSPGGLQGLVQVVSCPLQELSAGLQAEKEELDHQMELLLLESRGLQQQQTSLGLEVVTYRYAASVTTYLFSLCRAEVSQHALGERRQRQKVPPPRQAAPFTTMMSSY